MITIKHDVSRREITTGGGYRGESSDGMRPGGYSLSGWATTTVAHTNVYINDRFVFDMPGHVSIVEAEAAFARREAARIETESAEAEAAARETEREDKLARNRARLPADLVALYESDRRAADSYRNYREHAGFAAVRAWIEDGNDIDSLGIEHAGDWAGACEHMIGLSLGSVRVVHD